ncbi:MAG: NAD(P)H-dependent oxidoreductase [Clostridia bacterium]|nr:NAD(P)H-dependent oxidoreductase [Clostridia bacterium]
MKTIIIYYSYGGNTKSVAKLLQESTGYDAEEIFTVRPYSSYYNDVVEQGEREVKTEYMPPIIPLKADFSEYDTVILGTPVWWYSVAPAVRTFLTQYNLSGKTLYPFVTNGGWAGHALQDISALCKGATVKRGLDVLFEGDHRKVNKKRILNWAALINAES